MGVWAFWAWQPFTVTHSGSYMHDTDTDTDTHTLRTKPSKGGPTVCLQSQRRKWSEQRGNLIEFNFE